MVGSTGSGPAARPRRRRQLARLGGAVDTDHSGRQLLHRQALRAAGCINPDDWRLSITGLVAHEMSISLADLIVPATTRRRVHTRMLRQHRPPVLHRRHRKCGVGWCRVGSAVAAGTATRLGNRSRVLGNRLRHRRDPRQQRRPQRREHRRRRTGRRWWPRHHDHRAIRQEHDARGRDGAGQPAVLRDERRAAPARARGTRASHRARVGTASPTSSGSRASR